MWNLQHPDITVCERTGYPSWMRDEPDDGTVELWFDIEEEDE